MMSITLPMSVPEFSCSVREYNFNRRPTGARAVNIDTLFGDGVIFRSRRVYKCRLNLQRDENKKKREYKNILYEFQR